MKLLAITAVLAAPVGAAADDLPVSLDDARSETAEPRTPQPIIALDDTHTDGPVARQWLDIDFGYEHLFARHTAEAAELATYQIALGPFGVTHDPRSVASVFSWLDDYSVRVRFVHVFPSTGSVLGPLTVAVQRYFVAEPLAILPLIHLHAGLEAAVATPWLEDRHAIPPHAVQVVEGVDTELAESGYSIRPLGGYFRADAFACRNLYVAGGVAPELFVPADEMEPSQVALRWNVALGLSPVCSSYRESGWQPLAVAVEYRGRGRLYASGQPPDYHDQLAAVVQYDVIGQLAFSLYYAIDPGASWLRNGAFGARVQLGIEGRQ
jgi:hypothetical protein